MQTALDGVDRITLELYDNGPRMTCKELRTAEHHCSKTALRDIYLALYLTVKPDVKKKPKLQHTDALRECLDLPVFDDFREETTLDVVESTLGAIAIAEAFWKVDLQKKLSNVDMAKLRNAIRQAIEEVQERMDEIGEFEGDFGLGNEAGSGPGRQDMGPVEAKFIIAEAFRGEKFKRVMELVGRLRMIEQKGKKARKDTYQEEVIETELGDDIPSVLPSEFAEDDDIFDVKFCEGMLTQEEMGDKSTEGLGGIIVLQDKSGSMRAGDIDGFTRDEWGSAVLLGMLRVAKRQKRSLYHIPFTGVTRDEEYFSPSGADSVNVSRVIQRIGLLPSGGTCFKTALDRAVAVLADMRMIGERPDIIMVTDGENHLQPTYVKEMQVKIRQEGARFYCIAVGRGCEDLKEISTPERYYNHVELSSKRTAAFESIYDQIKTK